MVMPAVIPPTSSRGMPAEPPDRDFVALRNLRNGNAYALRRGPRRGRASLGLTAFVLAMLPVAIGPQDIAALIAGQPGTGDGFRSHLIASPFGTIDEATFSFPQPVGTGLPAGSFRLADFDPGGATAITRRAMAVDINAASFTAFLCQRDTIHFSI